MRISWWFLGNPHRQMNRNRNLKVMRGEINFSFADSSPRMRSGINDDMWIWCQVKIERFGFDNPFDACCCIGLSNLRIPSWLVVHTHSSFVASHNPNCSRLDWLAHARGWRRSFECNYVDVTSSGSRTPDWPVGNCNDRLSRSLGWLFVHRRML